MVTTTVKTEGFAEMEKLLFQMKSSTAKNTTARAMIKSLAPMEAMAKSLSPKDDRVLEEGIRTSRRATNANKTRVNDLEVYTGPIKEIAYAVPQEFGTVNHGPNPYMRPAWDATNYKVLNLFGYLQFQEIEKSIARAARKAARDAAKLKR